jgi:hypothetical protein
MNIKKNIYHLFEVQKCKILFLTILFIFYSSNFRRLPRHVLKFGFRELDSDLPETSLDSLRDESITKSRRRRIYMHLMVSKIRVY